MELTGDPHFRQDVPRNHRVDLTTTGRIKRLLSPVMAVAAIGTSIAVEEIPFEGRLRKSICTMVSNLIGDAWEQEPLAGKPSGVVVMPQEIDLPDAFPDPNEDDDEGEDYEEAMPQ